MSKMSNQWESPMHLIMPYLSWREIERGKTGAWDVGRHNHASFELHVIMSGACSLFVSNTEVLLQEGQGILLAPEAFHGPNRTSEEFCRFSVQFFAESELTEQILTAGEESYRVFEAGDTIRNLCRGIYEEITKTNRLFHKELLSSQFSQLMIHVFRAVQELPEHIPNHAPDSKMLEDMAVIDSFFVTTPLHQRNKENLAGLLHCSERQLLRKIYMLYGMSFREKLILSRIDTAQHLLRSTDKSIDEISHIVGYSDNAAFYRAFRIQTNTTPIKYRKQERAKAASES